MKLKFFFAATLMAGFLSAFVFVGCTTPQQTVAYNSIASVEATANAAIGGYYTLVVRGAAPTNSVPAVSRAYNTLQAACTLAAAASQAGTNALASDTLNSELTDLVNLISTAAKK